MHVIDKNLNKTMKINRKKFFTAAIASFLGITFLGKFPFKIFGNRTKLAERKLKVQINPSAVSRSKKEGRHA